MGSFKRALLGYRRGEVDATMAARDARAWALERDAAEARDRWQRASESIAELEHEVSSLSGMVIEREREIRGLVERLREADERHDRGLASLERVAKRLDEIQAQARGQATRIRMKALHDAVQVGRRAQELADAAGVGSARTGSSSGDAGADAASSSSSANPNGAGAAAGANASSDADAASDLAGLFEGDVRLEIGPLADFAQLVGFEDAVGRLGASEISVERFTEGRATVSMHLDEPVALLRELEERSPLEFKVRRTADDNLVLDVDEDQGPEQHAA
jgi:cell division septum initiation protein DivIVA